MRPGRRCCSGPPPYSFPLTGAPESRAERACSSVGAVSRPGRIGLGRVMSGRCGVSRLRGPLEHVPEECGHGPRRGVGR